MVKILESHIEIASTDLLTSSSTRPLCSYFNVLDSILLEMDCTLLVDSDLPKMLLSVSLKAFDIVLAVCADESPEGNLPASFRDIDIKAQKLINTSSASRDLSPGEKSQLILHHCFKTIKDATAALATCIERFPLPSKNSDGLALVEAIGETLCRLLGAVRQLISDSLKCANVSIDETQRCFCSR
jgi:hypothetical protein